MESNSKIGVISDGTYVCKPSQAITFADDGVYLISADLELASVEHGEWRENGLNGYAYAFVCSKCGYIDGYPFNDRFKYCPNCGAKMDGGANE